MLAQMLKLALKAAVEELERRYPDPAPPTAVDAKSEAEAPWNMVQEVAPAPKRRRRKAAAS